MWKPASITLFLVLCCFSPSRAQQSDWQNEGWLDELEEIGSLVGGNRYAAAIKKIEALLPYLDGMESRIDGRGNRLFAIIYGLLGHSYVALNETGNAEEALCKAWLYAEHLNDTIGIKRVISAEIGFLYCQLNNYASAESFLLAAKRLFEANLDLGLSYARLLNHLGIVASEAGRNLLAKAYLDTSVGIIEDLGMEYIRYKAQMLCNLSVIYNKMGYQEDALRIAFEARTIAEGIEDRNMISASDYYIGSIYAGQGAWNEAASYYKKSCERAEINDVNYTLMRYALAMTWFMVQNTDYESMSRAVSNEMRQDVISKFIFLTENERLIYWSYYLPYVNALNTMLSAKSSKENNKAVLSNTLFSKGLLLRTSTWISERIRNASSGDDRAKMDEREMLMAKLDENKLSADSTIYYHNRLLIVEKELQRGNISYSNLSDNLLADWKDISRNLDKDEVAIEFAPVYDGIYEEIPMFNKERYIAIVVTKNCKYPSIVSLCSQEEIEQLTNNLTRLSNSKYIKNLYSSDTPKSKGEKLYKLIWEPLEAYVSKATTIYYSPIGALSSLSFNALSHEGVFLCEKYNMRMVSSIAEIIRLKTESNEIHNSAAVYGGIAYDVDRSTLLANAGGYDHDRGGRVGEDDQERAGWSFLAGTVDEALGIQQRLEGIGVETQLYMGDSANEESFKAFDRQSPNILHIATHGFFLSDPKQVATNPFLRSIDNRNVSRTTHYLNRSGLLFAGGNRAWTGKEIIEGIDDGILTAEEISGLDLSNTDIVVLSACETGLGVSVSSEGVFGLQRAFKLAGVNTLIMSLWNVSDVTTSELMLQFYDNWMSGMEKHEAFYAAQKSIRNKSRDPYRWAGFVMMD